MPLLKSKPADKVAPKRGPVPPPAFESVQYTRLIGYWPFFRRFTVYNAPKDWALHMHKSGALPVNIAAYELATRDLPLEWAKGTSFLREYIEAVTEVCKAFPPGAERNSHLAELRKDKVEVGRAVVESFKEVMCPDDASDACSDVGDAAGSKEALPVYSAEKAQ